MPSASVGEFFTANMFNSAGGPNFQVNDVFKLPRLDPSVLNQTGVFDGMFQNLAPATPTQNRLAQDIIGALTYVPDSARGIFSGATCFLDRPYIDVNWGGDGAPRPSITISFDTASQGLTCTNPPGSTAIGQYLAVAKPAPDPRVDGYVFDNWYTTNSFDTVWDFNNACRDAMTLYARFVPVNTPAPDPTPDPKPVPAPSPDPEPGSISESASSAFSQQTLARTGDATMFAGLALAGTAGLALACMAFARAKRKAKDL